MERRAYLTQLAAAVTAANAGCSLNRFRRDSPDTVVEEFFRAFNNGGGDQMRELLHPDLQDEFDQEAAEEMSAYFQFGLDGIEVVEKNDDVAIVKYDGEFRGLFASEDQESISIELRLHDGKWRIYEFK